MSAADHLDWLFKLTKRLGKALGLHFGMQEDAAEHQTAAGTGGQRGIEDATFIFAGAVLAFDHITEPAAASGSWLLIGLSQCDP